MPNPHGLVVIFFVIDLYVHSLTFYQNTFYRPRDQRELSCARGAVSHFNPSTRSRNAPPATGHFTYTVCWSVPA